MVTDGCALLNKNLKLIVMILATFLSAIKISRQLKKMRQLNSLPFHFGKYYLLSSLLLLSLLVNRIKYERRMHRDNLT